MKILGYIVSGNKLSNIEGFVKQVDDISLADLTKPTLIVGWSLAKQFEGYNILERKLGDNLYWTFGRSENRSEFETDLKKFYSVIRENMLKNVDYQYIDVIKFNYSDAKKMLNILISGTIKTIYINDGMAYSYFNDKIYGFSLDIMEYCRVSREKLLKKLKDWHVKFIDNRNRDVTKLGRFLGNKKYAIPYFVE